uniref:Protein translocase subunit SecY n=1 Tax=Diacronema lutheri TaxID=2081491 RepID=SECY_DIALT|nr:RecName: Full=Protein translocase subunit SecY [Diacronema lutheri]CAA45998.1 secY [Diacronema lutheri]prf//1813203A secY gene [Diacronema lutheri]
MKKAFVLEGPLVLRLFRTIMILIFARLGNYIPIPGITEVESFYESSFRNTSIYNLSALSGGSNVISILTLGLGPFFSASLAVQFLVKLYPAFEKLQNEEGEEGRKTIVRYTRILTVLFCIIESFFLSNSLRSFVFNWNSISYFVVAAAVTTGSLVLVWLSEVITERGIGNGSSLLILIGNLSRFRFLINKDDFDSLNVSSQSNLYIIYIIITLVSMLIFSTLSQEGARKIPVVSAKQLIDGVEDDMRRSYIPIRFGQAGVVPIIFSSSILLFLTTSIKQLPNANIATRVILDSVNLQQIFYFFTFLVLIIFFSFFYTLIILSPSDIAKNLKKMSSVIQDTKPGVATKVYIRKFILQASFVGSILLSALILIPSILAAALGVHPLSISGITSLILSFSIINDTVRQVLAYRDTRKFLLSS